MNRFSAAVIAAIVAIAATVLALHEPDPYGLLATIHATARTSAICFAFAFARIRTLYALWIIFVVAFLGRDMSNPVYPALMFMLLTAPIVRYRLAPPRPVER